MAKKILKALGYTILSIIGFVIVLFFVAKLAENKITHMALDRVSKVIKAPVKIENVSFTLLRRFPNATIEFNGVFLGGNLYGDFSDSTAQTNDTLANIGTIFFSVKSRPLIDGKFDIVRIEFLDAQLNYRIDSLGRTCYDFLSDTTAVPEEPIDTTTSAPLDVLLRELYLKNVACQYIDDSSKMQATVTIPEMKLNGKIEGENYSGAVKGTLELTQLSMAGYNLNLMRKTALDMDLVYANDSVTIDYFNIDTDGAKLKIAGGVSLLGNMVGQLKIEGDDFILSELIKYAPDTLLTSYGVTSVDGIFSFEANIAGPLTDSLALPFYTADLSFKNGEASMSGYPALQNISFSGTVTNGDQRSDATTSAVFKKFHIETAQSKVDASFSVKNLEHMQYNLETKMLINLAEFKPMLPDTLIQQLNGVLKVQMTTKGILPDNIDDSFNQYVLDNSTLNLEASNINVQMDTLLIKQFSGELDYTPRHLSVNKLTMKVPTYQVNLKNTGIDLTFWGNLNKTSTMGLDIKKFNLEIDRCKMSGSAWVQNLDMPTYRFKGNVSLDLAELQKFVPDTLVTKMSGIFNMAMNSHGTVNLDSIEAQMNSLVFEQSDFSFEFKDINVEMPDTLTNVQHLSGLVTLKSDTMLINKFGGTVSGLDFMIDSTEIWNIYKAYMLGDSNALLVVQTNFHMGTFDYAMLNAFMPADTTNQDNSASATTTTDNTVAQTQPADTAQITDSVAPLLPDFKALGLPHFLIRGKFTMDKVIYDKNVIDDISMLFRFSDSLYVIDQFKFKTSGGEFNTSLKLDARKWEQPMVDIKSYINNLDLQMLLKLNDNFGDTLLTYDKVSGIMTSELHARAFYIKGEWPTERMRAKGNFKLENGKIYNYPPLTELSKSMKMFGGLDELDRLDFSTLTSSIFIFKNKIYIPKTDVVTSAIDLSAFAMQDFKTDYEYHLVVHLNDVLLGKSKKLLEAQAKQSENKGTAGDREGLNLVSMQIGKETKNGFDNETLKKKFMNELNKQQGFLNLAFNPLLVNFSTDFDRTIQQKAKIEKLKKP